MKRAGGSGTPSRGQSAPERHRLSH
jgi:hypothetical protein